MFSFISTETSDELYKFYSFHNNAFMIARKAYLNGKTVWAKIKVSFNLVGRSNEEDF